MVQGGPIEIADDFCQLVMHVLAHVPLDGPGNLHDPRYVAWAREHQSPEARALLEHDAGLLARAWAKDPKLDPLHAYVELHDGLPGLRITATRALAEIDSDEVAAPELLATLRALPAAELLHATLSLLVDEFERAILPACRAELEGARAELARSIDAISPALPGLGDARIELCWALGPHGRALPRRILVGAPASWNQISPIHAAIVAAHEHAVRSTRSERYLICEWRALTTLSRRILDHDSSLRRAHASWLVSLDLDALLRDALSEDLVGEREAELLRERPEMRQSVLSELADKAGSDGS